MKLLLILFILLLNIANAQVNESETMYFDPDYSEKIKTAQIKVKNLMGNKNIPGLSIAISTKRHMIWAQGFGYADLENKTIVNINSKFRIGSISKTLTALAIAKLVNDGKINLADDIRNYVPYFPEKKFTITIGQLASHTAGIRDYDYKNGEYFNSLNYKTVEQSVGIFKDDTLLFKPGKKYSYSTYGYVLLSAVIEGATNMNFLDYMHDSILLPLSLKNTVPDHNQNIIENRVRFYDEIDGKVVNGIFVDNSNKWAGGGYLSTSLDLVKMCQSLLNNKFLSESSKQLLWTSAVLLNGQKTNYGIGWKQNIDSLGRKYVYHGGSSIGGRSLLMVYPKEELVVAITCNLSTYFDEKFVSEVAEIFIKQ
jgi:serine beta-lactamase-like protein LACTB